jgi:hypothetical protein
MQEEADQGFGVLTSQVGRHQDEVEVVHPDQVLFRLPDA